MNQSLTVGINGNAAGLQAAVNTATSSLNSLAVSAAANSARLGGSVAQGTAQARNSLGQFVAGAGRAGTDFNSVFTQRIGASLTAFGKSLESVGNKLSLTISAPLALLGRQAISTYADMDSLRRGLATLEKDGASLQARLGELNEVAKLPGLGVKESLQFDIALRSAGFSADLSKRSMLAFGNALASVGKGKAELQGLSLQLQQLAGKTQGYGQDLKIIKEYSPQLTDALQKAFGTADFGKLADSGKTGKQIIEGVVAEYEKLPKATGGIKNAIENLQDTSLKVFDALGYGITKAFKLEDVSTRLTSFGNDIVDKFNNASPAVQKFGLVIAAAAIVIPPVLATLGLLATTILPAIATGFGLLFSPITLAVGAIAGVGYLIYKNWELVKKTLTDTGIFSTVGGLVADAFTTIKELFSQGVAFAIRMWDRFGKSIIDIVKGAFSITVTVFNTFGNVLAGIFRIIDGVLTGSWDKTWSGIRMAAGSALGGIIQLMAKSVGVIGGLFADLLEHFKLKGAADGLRTFFAQANKDAETFTKFLQGDKTKPLEVKLPDLKKGGGINLSDYFKGFNFGGPNVKDGSDFKEAPDDKKKKVPGRASDYKDRTDTPVEKLKREIDDLEKDIQSKLLLNFKVPDEAFDRLKDLKNQLEAVEALGNNFDLGVIRKNLTQLTAEISDLKRETQNKIAFGIDVSPETFKKIRELEDQVKKTGDVVKLFGTQKLEIHTGNLAANQAQDPETQNRFRIKLPSLTAVAGQLQVKLDTQKAVDGIKADLVNSFREIPDFLKGSSLPKLLDSVGKAFASGEVVDNIQASTTAISNALKSAKQQLGQDMVGVLEGIGESVGEGKNPLKSALKMVLDLLGGYLIQLGTALLFSSKVLLAAAPFTFGLTIGPGLGNEIAGAGLILGGGLVKGLASAAFAEGGLVTGPVMGLVGEGRGTSRSNPEVISPLNKLKSMIGDTGGGGGTLSARVSGNDLLILMERAQDKRTDFRGY